MLQLKVPQRDFAAVVTAVLCTRLIRKLCDACKVGYAPTPDLLKKLGIPAGKIEALYRLPKPEEVEKPCQECGGLGFKGRTGLFELLVVNDQFAKSWSSSRSSTCCAKRPAPPACDRSRKKACCWWPKASRRWPNYNAC